jgi:hypothetical protein
MFRYNSSLFRYNPPLFRYNSPLFRYNPPLFRYNPPLFRYNAPLFRYNPPLFRYNAPFFQGFYPLFSYNINKKIILMGLTQPRKDADFIAWANNILTQCVARQTEWQLNAAQVTQFQDLFKGAWDAAAANRNPETANRLTAANKRVSFAALRAFLSTFVNILVANTAISEGDLQGMGLPSREHHFHEPLAPPTEAPENTAVVGQHHDIIIYVAIPQHGHPSEFLTKKGYHGFVVRYRKDGETEWHEEYSTRLHLTLLFDSEDEGKHVTVKTAWINPRIQRGPWSDEISVMIN